MKPPKLSVARPSRPIAAPPTPKPFAPSAVAFGGTIAGCAARNGESTLSAMRLPVSTSQRPLKPSIAQAMLGCCPLKVNGIVVPFAGGTAARVWSTMRLFV